MPTINKPKRKNNSYRRQQRQDCYSMKQWKELSKWYRQLHPICEMCAQRGDVTPSEHVHHILSPFEPNLPSEVKFERLLDVSNLMALCRDCHNEVHGNVKKSKKNTQKSELFKT